MKDLIADQLAVLHSHGAKVVVVHGAGHEIGRWVSKLQLPAPQFIAGCRVTDSDTMVITEMVLGGLVNGDLTSRISARGVPALGVSGRSAQLTTATVKKGPKGEQLGRVGELAAVNTDRISKLLTEGYMLVMPCYSQDETRAPLNINGDHFAASLAGAIRAEWCIFLTNVPGVMQNGTVIPTLEVGKALTLIESGVVSGGMIPKVESACKACGEGAQLSVIADAAERDILLTLLSRTSEPSENKVGTIFSGTS